MKAKTFFIAVLSCALALLAGTAAMVAWVDPLLTAEALEEGETALFVNERYELAGLIRRQDYESLLMGTSLAANYRASWFTEGTGKKTLKVSFPDGRLSEFDTALNLAFRTHGTLDTVYFCLDPNMLIREDQSSELPEYLYNDNPLDDLQFYFNGESLALAVKSLMLGDEDKVTLDDAYVWEKNYEFSRRATLEGYHRPEAVETALPDGAYLETAAKNLDVVCGWAEARPDVRFVIWFPPYSILYWDMMLREGKADAILSAVEYASLRLLEYGNVSVHCFMHNVNYITDLNCYTDHIHCSALITAWQAQNLMEGKWKFNEENCGLRLEELREYIKSYDFEALLDS